MIRPEIETLQHGVLLCITLRKCWGVWRKGQITTEESVDLMEEVVTELYLNCERENVTIQERENGPSRRES